MSVKSMSYGLSVAKMSHLGIIFLSPFTPQISHARMTGCTDGLHFAISGCAFIGKGTAMIENKSPNIQQLQEVIAASDMLEIQSEITVRINDANFPEIRLDPNTLYCSKTGQVIGLRDANSIFSAIKIFGKKAFLQNAVLVHGLQCAPAWIVTDGVHLDKLMDQDPIAYATYCMGVICSKYTNPTKNYDRQAIMHHHYSLARAFALMSQDAKLTKFNPLTNETPIVELNWRLCEALTFGQIAIHFLMSELHKFAKSPDLLARAACNGVLTEILENAVQDTNKAIINHEFAKLQLKKFEDFPTSPEDAARGPSNIRQQSRSKNRVRVSQLQQQFNSFGFGHILTEAQRDQRKQHDTQTGKLALFDLIQTENNISSSLKALMETDLDKWTEIDTGDNDDNEVIVTTISHREADYLTGKNVEPIAPVVKSNLFALLAPSPVIETPKPIVPGFMSLLAKKGTK